MRINNTHKKGVIDEIRELIKNIVLELSVESDVRLMPAEIST
jgi:hypothetical protein